MKAIIFARVSTQKQIDENIIQIFVPMQTLKEASICKFLELLPL